MVFSHQMVFVRICVKQSVLYRLNFANLFTFRAFNFHYRTRFQLPLEQQPFTGIVALFVGTMQFDELTWFDNGRIPLSAVKDCDFTFLHVSSLLH